MSSLGVFTFLRISLIIHCDNSHQFKLALDSMLWWERYRYTPHVFGTSILRTTSFLPQDRVHCSHRKSHGYPPSRGFWPERARWITACSRTTGGERRPHIATTGVDMPLKQVSPEESILREIRRLIVRMLIDSDVFGLGTNKLPGGTIIPLKYYCHSTRYVPVPQMKRPPDGSEGVICYEGKDRRFVEMAG